MGSYKLYVAVMAIAGIAAVQEVSCARKIDEQYDEQGEFSELEMEHHQCEEYKSKIWDNAFSNKAAMQLMELTSKTAKELGSDEVCSDTARAFLNFVNVMATDQNAHFSLGMLMKMLMFILREMDTTSIKFRETRELFERIAKSPEIREFILRLIVRIINLLKEPESKGRLSKVMKSFESIIKPSDNEELVKKRIRGITNASTKMAKGAMNRVGDIFRRFS